ncbi:amino acid ABC transporter substrate-binding protein [Natronospira bacteriovora]|uniref:Amino acid ABC transporter substrate-binding protein n=1 Tax=Natronospira bacteriovora TaxID=3069753 RepID=A0ABU0W3S7_9GAMM|nr:amino acid ABC transporter substrate-binding protein [Natronospira sp. AB-CW4]MDQ2068609.1 amino acid ABC transporter substrate-binding protein [Natronospira sp. AB-CW4]
MPTLRRTLALTTAVAAMTAGACGEEPGPLSDEPIVIGATQSLTGAYATQGQAAYNGYRLCEAGLNEEGGLLGRPVEFIIHDDESDSERAMALYDTLISETGVDAVLGPYGSTLTEAVAPVTERYRMVHVSPLAATSSIWEQGREYLFMVLPPAELFLAGLIHMADDHGVERIAVLAEDQLFPGAAAQGAAELARERGMSVVLDSRYESGREDFSAILEAMDEAGADVLAMAASNLDDFITVTRQLKELDITLKMFGTSGAVDEYIEALGADGEFTYGLSAWEPTLPYPGIDSFVEAYEAQFERRPSFHAAGAYGSCQLFALAIEMAGSLDADAIRHQLLNLETTTIFGPFAVDERGYQTANQGVFIQWQDGDKVVVWPEEQATASPRIPTPAWDER